MKTTLPVLVLILISVSLYGQNENPYSIFGYEVSVMPDKTQEVDKLLLINQDSTSSVWMLAVDPSARTITIFDRNKIALQYDTLTNYTMMRWLSPDPYGQFSSPYLGMGNTPHMSADPDGGWSWIMAGVGFAVGAGVGYAITGDWEGALIGGLAGGLVGGASFNQGTGNAMRFNGGFREYGGLSISFNSKLYSGIGNAFGSAGKFLANNSGIITGAARSYLSAYHASPKWQSVGSVNLPFVGQAPYAEWCVYACGQSVDSWLGGSRTASDFAKWQNGGVTLDKGPGTVGDWLNFWKKNFPYPNFVNGGFSPPSTADIVKGLNSNQIYSTAIHESSFPPNYDHNVLIQSVEQHIKSGKYRYVLMDPNGVRTLPEKYFNAVHRRHVIIKK